MFLRNLLSQQFVRNMHYKDKLLEIFHISITLLNYNFIHGRSQTKKMISITYLIRIIRENQKFIIGDSCCRTMAEKWVPTKPNFGPPPANYIAGLGRGATGFVTRSDLGPAARANNIVKTKENQDQQAAYADHKYDSWEGYKGALFTKNQMDEQDRQADDAFDFCERRMEQRRLQQKQRKIKQELLKQQKMKKNANNMPISEQFTDLKRELAKVTQEQWMNLPQAVDLSIKKRKKQKYVPVPDSLIVNHLNTNSSRMQTQSIEQSNQNFRQAKEILLKSNLQKAQNEAGSRPQIDRIGYLTHLQTSKVGQQMVGDIKRARLLHKAALVSNPKNADVWLSAARIQQIDGKIEECRNILRKSLQVLPLNEDIWIELSRVERAEQSKNILIEALKHLPTSQKLWLAIARKQQQKDMKSKILRKALENLPQSTILWKQLIELSSMQEAINLLYKAVECLPRQIDLWIGLAKLQTYQNAKQVLNKARKANPLNLAIWISAAKLEQTQSDNHQKAVNKIQLIITKGRQTLKKNGNSVSRQELLQQALICERSSNFITCQSIVKSVISLGLTEDELNFSIFKDVDLFQKQYGSVQTTRFLYKYGIIQTKNQRLLQKMLQFQQRLAIIDLRDPNNKKCKIMQSLQFGLKTFPDNINFWLAMIDRLIDMKKFKDAQNVIQNALKSLQNQQKQFIYLKKVQVLKRTEKLNEARILLSEIRQQYKQSNECSIEAVKLEYQDQKYEQAWKICSDLFKKDKKQQRIWQLAMLIKDKMKSYQQYRNIAQKAITQHFKSIRLWKRYIQFEIENKFEGRARNLIDRALMKNPKNQQIYLILIQLEIKTGVKKQISSTISKALKQCPKCGQIWGIAIIMEPSNTRKKKASVAIQNCGTDSSISCAVAKVFWKDNKIDKARKWLQDAINIDKTNGDIWAYYYKLISQHFPQQAQRVQSDFLQIGKISHGRKWTKVKENSIDGWKLNEQQILERVVHSIGNEIYEIQ